MKILSLILLIVSVLCVVGGFWWLILWTSKDSSDLAGLTDKKGEASSYRFKSKLFFRFEDFDKFE